MTKVKGVNYPTVEAIKNCVKNNPDGFSMAWACDGKLYTYKTMNADEFMRMYVHVTDTYAYKQTSMVLHARIATHGSKRIENCHCWTDGDQLAFAHNGILRDIVCDKDKTDSETFFRRVFLPVWKIYGWCDLVNRIVDLAIGTCKFAFIGKNGYIHMYGNWINENGVKYSNDSYKPRRAYYGSIPMIESRGAKQPWYSLNYGL